MTPAFDVLRGDLLELADFVATLDALDPPPPHVFALSRHVQRFMASLEAVEVETRGDGGHAPHGDSHQGTPVDPSRVVGLPAQVVDSRPEQPDSLACQ